MPDMLQLEGKLLPTSSSSSPASVSSPGFRRRGAGKFLPVERQRKTLSHVLGSPAVWAKKAPGVLKEGPTGVPNLLRSARAHASRGRGPAKRSRGPGGSPNGESCASSPVSMTAPGENSAVDNPRLTPSPSPDLIRSSSSCVRLPLRSPPSSPCASHQPSSPAPPLCSPRSTHETQDIVTKSILLGSAERRMPPG